MQRTCYPLLDLILCHPNKNSLITTLPTAPAGPAPYCFKSYIYYPARAFVSLFTRPGVKINYYPHIVATPGN